MGAHGTLEEALQGVAAFNAPSSEDEELQNKRHKSTHSKAKSHKHKHKREKEQRKKEKRGKSKKHRKDRQESSEDSDSYADDMEKQLERGRAAVRITREILQKQPDLKQDLRQVGPVGDDYSPGT
jgi:hypothetical protein